MTEAGVLASALGVNAAQAGPGLHKFSSMPLSGKS
jgi:hypothetical protein